MVTAVAETHADSARRLVEHVAEIVIDDGVLTRVVTFDVSRLDACMPNH